MKKLSILSICGLAVSLLTGCTFIHKESELKDYLSKETIEIPNKGDITIINQGASDKEYNNKVVLNLLVKASSELQPFLVSSDIKEGKNYPSVTLPAEASGYYSFYTVYNQGETEPARFQMKNFKDGTVYVDRYYYPVINPNLNLGLDPEWFNN
ncbi:hypothetical protein R4Y45_04185 [Holzapfeliella sp. He02]|uniref:Lipoprotein n=1 Tax=Holzapfeliella saturejae TaxID=3082953 RepID=A0ABU8SGB8_9LACO